MHGFHDTKSWVVEGEGRGDWEKQRRIIIGVSGIEGLLFLSSIDPDTQIGSINDRWNGNDYNRSNVKM